MCREAPGCDGADRCYSRNASVILDVEAEQVRYPMGNKVMVNNIPMSVIYAGMTVDRFYKLARLMDEAADQVMRNAVLKDESPPSDPLHNSIDVWSAALQKEFDKLCARAAKKAEWNNKPNNKINKIVRVRKQKVSSK